MNRQLTVWTHPKLNLKINPALTKQQAATYVSNWEPQVINWDNSSEVIDFFSNNCITGGALLKGKRNAPSVVHYTLLPLDFDNGIVTVDDFIAKGKLFQFSWALFTTVSHGKLKSTDPPDATPNDRFRVIIPLDQETSIDDKEVLAGLLKKTFPGAIDPASFTPSQYFFCSPNPVFTRVFNYPDPTTGETVFLPLPEHTVPTIKSAKTKTSTSTEALANKSITKAPTSTSKNTEHKTHPDLQDPETIVMLKDKSYSTIKDQIENLHSPEDKILLYCPFCKPEDRTNDSHNSFLSCNMLGHVYLSCSSQHMTFWFDPDGAQVTTLLQLMYANNFTKYVEYNSLRENKIHRFADTQDQISYCLQKKITHKLFLSAPRVDVICDPERPTGLTYDPERRRAEDIYNIFTETIYMTKDRSKLKRIPLDQLILTLQAESTKYIYTILHNTLQNDEYIAHFINWLATLFQTRRKMTTSWIIATEVHGTGKGLFFERVLRPIFGKLQTALYEGKNVGANFNGSQLHNKWLVAYDEVFTKEGKMTDNGVKELLKTQITSENLSLEWKGKDIVTVKNILNVIIFSNSSHPLPMDDADRRYNVTMSKSSKQLNKEPWYGTKELMAQRIDNEVEAFSDILALLEYDSNKSESVLETEFKDSLKTLTKDVFGRFAQALEKGDYDFFALQEIFPSTTTDKQLHSNSDQLYESSEATRVAGFIRDYHGFPAEYLTHFMPHFFKSYTIDTVRQRLKSLKIQSESVKLRKTRESVRMYRSKNISAQNEEETQDDE